MRKNKAISPVIATLLLILIAIAAAVLVYVWVTGFATGTTSKGAPELEEKFKVEATSYTSGTGLKIYIRNIGLVPVVIDTIYIRDSTGSLITVSDVDITISAGSLTSTTLDTGLSLNRGTTYIIKLVSSYGTEVQYVFRVR